MKNVKSRTVDLVLKSEDGVGVLGGNLVVVGLVVVCRDANTITTTKASQ